MNMKITIIGLVMALIGLFIIIFTESNVACIRAPCPPLTGYYYSLAAGAVLVIIGLVLVVVDYRKSHHKNQ